MSGECVISSVLFCHNKNLKRRTGVTALGRAGVTAPSYSSVLLENKGKYILKAGRLADPKDTKRRETESEPWPFGSSFFVFSPPPDLPCVNWASQECCLLHLRPSLRPPTFLCSIFASFSLPCLLVTVILDSFFLFLLPNNHNLVYIFAFLRQRHPTPVLLPGKSHGRKSLVGCSPWGR